MRTHLQLTAASLLAAIATVGCSNPFEEPKTRAQQQPLMSTRPSTSTQAAAIAVPTAGELPITSAGPVSFADGDAAYQAKNYGEAARLFERYTERRPDNAWGHFMLGLSASKTGDLATAEGAFEKALKIDPNHVKSLVNLSRVLIDQHRFEDAIVRLTHAGEVDPGSVDVQRLLGRAYAAEHKTEEAMNAYRGAIALDSQDAWSMNNLGLLLLDEGHAEEALPLLCRAVQLRTDVPAFHNNLGMALEHTGRFRAAAEEYRGALTADPAYGKAKQNLARVEAVKVGHEEPFDLEAMAQRSPH